MSSEMTPQSTIMEIVSGSYLAQALHAVAKLGIADHFGGGRKTTAELAEAAQVHEGALRRTLRALAGSGVFEAFPDDQWGLTPVGDVLRSDSPTRLRNTTIAGNDTVHWGAWGRFADALVTGKPQVEKVFGCTTWDYYKQHSEDGAAFGGYMEDLSDYSLDAILEGYDFTGTSVIADIGGGHGALLAGVLRKNKSASGILIDRAEVLKGAPEVLGDVGCRVKCVEGNFVTDEMPKADIYLLKHVMHDWNDDECVTILKGLSAVMSPTSKILIIEMIFLERDEPGLALTIDLNMLVMHGGMERTVEEFGVLFNKASLELVRAVKTKGMHIIVEAKLQ